MTDILWIASFDIGKKNFSFYIEEINTSKLVALKNIPKTQRYNINGSTTDNFEQLMKNVYNTGEKNTNRKSRFNKRL